jgi:uroporphyrinogen decarboxylase
MRQAGRYLPEYRELRAQARDFIDFCLTPELAAEATLQPLRRFPLSAAIVFADILLIPYAAGAGVRFVEGEGPRMEPQETATKIKRLDWGSVGAGLAPVSETIARVRKALATDKTLIGFAGGPWTVATYMISGGKDPDRWRARTLAWREPKVMALLLAKLLDATANYLIAQARAGADALMLFDSWSESLPEPLFERVVIAPTSEVIGRVREAGVDVPIIGFPRGSGSLAARYAAETGVTALSLDVTNASPAFLRLLPAGFPVQGGYDPALLAAGGDAFEAEIDRLLDITAARPYVFNLGHGITPDTPVEHVARLIEHVTAAR